MNFGYYAFVYILILINIYTFISNNTQIYHKILICGHDSDILIESRWKLIERVGEGMFGCVARAYDSQLKRDVAVKFGSISRTEIEYQEKAGKIGISPAIIAKGKYYFVMDYVFGELLHDVLITPKIKDDLMCLCYLLDEIKILHSDLHDKNIKLNKNGKPIVLDFGIAKSFTDELLTNKNFMRRYGINNPANITQCYERYQERESYETYEVVPEKSMFEKFMSKLREAFV